MIRICEQLIRAGLPNRYLGNCWLDLVLLAGLYAALIVLFMGLVPLGSRLHAARQQMLAAAYGMLLYRRIPQRVIRCEAALVYYNLKYLLYLSPTLVFGGLVFAAAFDPLHERYGCPPLQVGQGFIVSVEGPGDLPADADDFAVDARVRVPKLKRAWAKLTARHPGLLPLQVGSHVLALNVDRPDIPRVAKRVWGDLTVQIAYPPGNYRWLGGFAGTGLALAGILVRVAKVQV
ncbi:MAG: hypothetical protein ACM359_25040 [Bacillota bacterium]